VGRLEMVNLKTREQLQAYLEKVATNITAGSPVYAAHVSVSAYLPVLIVRRKGCSDE